VTKLIKGNMPTTSWSLEFHSVTFINFMYNSLLIVSLISYITSYDTKSTNRFNAALNSFNKWIVIITNHTRDSHSQVLRALLFFVLFILRSSWISQIKIDCIADASWNSMKYSHLHRRIEVHFSICFLVLIFDSSAYSQFFAISN